MASERGARIQSKVKGCLKENFSVAMGNTTRPAHFWAGMGSIIPEDHFSAATVSIIRQAPSLGEMAAITSRAHF